ncbi:MAG: bifunctional [glutamate--ammonia ligase]-adenylyl-L-tyrosine phosphorylase/[glutamate--ammonia-ligase] adenylyltransferase, partial [Planctomycetales bacterium]|nr:bifunctional [glutamate--ammonia ligase]-adenylyl-L-tyrosine phosphorylase/[glutamate--ammonia-ligase] adenylyltransferase [Planctomycetales bacterium]
MIVYMSNSLPLLLQSTVQRHWEAFTESAKPAEVGGVLPNDALTRVWASSEFVARACIRNPELLAELMESGDLYRRYEINECRAKLDEALDECSDEPELTSVLRSFRRREMVRIAWRDLAGDAALEEVLVALSDLADACTDAALTVLHRWQCEEWGVPVDGDGRRQTMVVLGMGKLGARELNFSSDIDLIFAYPEDGQIIGPKVKTNAEYFIRLARRLIKVIDEKTADGFVFRVDMRLRPFGESGPLVMNFSQMEGYYTSQGREWERYALIKARPIAGDPAAGAELISMLKPFVYRRYLDYGTFEQLREMKAMIAREVARRRLRDNIKLGPGGIREIEFIGQAFQLVRGGRESRLQQRGILDVLQALAELSQITAQTRDELSDAYVFLRRTENRLQAYADMQSQTLPDDEVGRVRLAFTMGY